MNFVERSTNTIRFVDEVEIAGRTKIIRNSAKSILRNNHARMSLFGFYPRLLY